MGIRNNLGLALLLGAGAATAQVPPHLASCSELRDGARKAQTEACVLYAPCNTVLPARKTCEEATAFIDRLLGGIESRIAGFFGRKPKQLTAEAVFEANAPQLKLDAAWEEKLKAMRGQMKAAGEQALAGMDSDGAWIYEGDVQDGRMHGLGTKLWAAGFAYRGQFDNGAFSGFGELVPRDGSRLIGDFRRNRPDGKILVVYRSGASYDGEVKEGPRHGTGTYRFADGSTHVGSWLNGKQHGPGTATDASGRQTVGHFEDGKLVGAAVAAPQASVTASVPTTPSTPAPPADPVAAARDGCTSSENSCQKVCAGVGAIGIFSVLRGGRSDEASRQLEQCQARCTSEKSACDVKVADLERQHRAQLAGAEQAERERRARAEREERERRLRAEMADDPRALGGSGRVQ